MENEKRDLTDLTTLEAEEFEKMAGIIRRKNEALSKLDVQSIKSAVSDELDELNKIQHVEKVRAEILKAIGLTGNDLKSAAAMERQFGKEGSAAYRQSHARLQDSFSRVQKLNVLSRDLLSHSMNFIRQNIRILTDGGNRKLVDRKA